MATLRQKLLALKSKYCLTTTDLGILLNSNRSTVYYWEQGVQPAPSKLPLIEQRLVLVHGMKKFLPVPLNITQYQRKRYLLDAVNVAIKLSKTSTAARR